LQDSIKTLISHYWNAGKSGIGISHHWNTGISGIGISHHWNTGKSGIGKFIGKDRFVNSK
jgi:hypothetical protein